MVPCWIVPRSLSDKGFTLRSWADNTLQTKLLPGSPELWLACSKLGWVVPQLSGQHGIRLSWNPAESATRPVQVYYMVPVTKSSTFASTSTVDSGHGSQALSIKLGRLGTCSVCIDVSQLEPAAMSALQEPRTAFSRVRPAAMQTKTSRLAHFPREIVHLYSVAPDSTSASAL